MFLLADRGTVFAGAKGSDVQSAVFPGICVLPSGRWMSGFRAAPTKGGSVGHKSLITWSDDEGRTWSELWDTGVPGQPAAPVSLPDGRIAMVYVDRTAAPVIKVRASSDGGRTWPEETETPLTEAETVSQTWSKSKMQDAWAEMGAFSIGLPATAPLPNGDVLVVYYSGPETDFTSICWARLRT